MLPLFDPNLYTPCKWCADHGCLVCDARREDKLRYQGRMRDVKAFMIHLKQMGLLEEDNPLVQSLAAFTSPGAAQVLAMAIEYGRGRLGDTGRIAIEPPAPADRWSYVEIDRKGGSGDGS